MSPHWAHLVEILDNAEITVVLDIGANIGQYATDLRQSGYRGRIVSFEPLSAARKALEGAARDDRDWSVAPRMAIGADDGEAVINQSAESDMSSLLPFEPAFLESSPTSAVVAQETVAVKRLDSVFDEFTQPNDRVFVKIDTQGYEREVLDGSAGVIERITGLQVEMSLVPLYAGEAMFAELFARLGDLGFAPHLIIPGYFSRHLHRQLQIDGVFLRKQE